ncbi:hypothetical protein PSPO01_01907 [Paraphaeosphaeria sporulosa]
MGLYPDETQPSSVTASPYEAWVLLAAIDNGKSMHPGRRAQDYGGAPSKDLALGKYVFDTPHGAAEEEYRAAPREVVGEAFVESFESEDAEGDKI